MSNDMVRPPAAGESRDMALTHWHQPLIVPLATGVLLLEESAQVDAPWSGGGSGTTSVTSDGVSERPRFEYNVHGDGGAWSFSTKARCARRIALGWSYTGFHAWFNVRVELERFVRRGQVEIFQETLTEADQFAAPGGFAYYGSSMFDVWPGDVYGFRMSGSDFG
jgi:hypothetical protein